MFELLENSIYTQLGMILMACLFGSLVLTYIAQKINPGFRQGFVVVRSWCFLAPLIYFGFALRSPYPLVILTVLSLYGAKNFFQMTGMYHRSNFVLVSYLGIIASGYCIHRNWFSLNACLLYTSPSPRDRQKARMPSSA